MKLTEDQVADVAERSAFYVLPQTGRVRILYCDTDMGYFQAEDEDTGEEYRIDFEEVAELEDPIFYELKQVDLEVVFG